VPDWGIVECDTSIVNVALDFASQLRRVPCGGVEWLKRIAVRVSQTAIILAFASGPVSVVEIGWNAAAGIPIIVIIRGSTFSFTLLATGCGWLGITFRSVSLIRPLEGGALAEGQFGARGRALRNSGHAGGPTNPFSSFCASPKYGLCSVSNLFPANRGWKGDHVARATGGVCGNVCGRGE